MLTYFEEKNLGDFFAKIAAGKLYAREKKPKGRAGHVPTFLAVPLTVSSNR